METEPDNSPPSKASLLGLDGLNFQLLDGVAAGIFGVISVVIAADLMRETSRFNLAQGFGFLTLGAIALAALVFFALLMPETRPDSALDGHIAASSPAQAAS